jgi:hypothetical protein
LIENVFELAIHPALSALFPLSGTLHDTFWERPEDMAGKKYPQFLLIGDSIVQYTSYLREGVSFGAALEERE